MKYSLSPERYRRRLIETSGRSRGRTSSWLETRRLTSATPSGLRVSLPGKYDVLHVLGAQGFGGLLAEDPFHGVHDIALPAAIGPQEGRNAVGELDLDLVREGFESEDLESL